MRRAFMPLRTTRRSVDERCQGLMDERCQGLMDERCHAVTVAIEDYQEICGCAASDRDGGN